MNNSFYELVSYRNKPVPSDLGHFFCSEKEGASGPSLSRVRFAFCDGNRGGVRPCYMSVEHVVCSQQACVSEKRRTVLLNVIAGSGGLCNPRIDYKKDI